MPYRHDPQQAGRHPFELFTLYLALLTALPTVLGVVPQPGTMRAVLPGFVVAIWAWILLVGSIVTLAGIYWKDRGTGLITEQLGLALVGASTLLYAGVLLAVAGEPAVITGAILGGFGASCLLRYYQIQQTVDRVHSTVKAIHGPDGHDRRKEPRP